MKGTRRCPYPFPRMGSGNVHRREGKVCGIQGRGRLLGFVKVKGGESGGANEEEDEEEGGRDGGSSLCSEVGGCCHI